MRYFEVFAGVGGFSIGIHNAYENISKSKGKQQGRNKNDSPDNEQEFLGTQQPTCVGFSEIDRFASQVLKYHYPDIKNWGDITKITPSELPDFDLLVSGFPCQSFSIAGKRGGFKDTRGTLFFEIARIAKIKRPPLLLLENVKGLLNHDKGNTFATIISTLDELGYDCQWSVLNSKNFGVPQNRERVFIVGHFRGTPRPKVFPIGEYGEGIIKKGGGGGNSASIQASYRKGVNNQNQLVYEGAIMSEKNKKWLEDGKELSRNFPQGQRVYSSKGIATSIASQAGGLGAKTGLYAIPVLTPDRLVKRQNGRRFKNNGEPSFSLTKQDIHGVSDGTSIRRLTPTECERLQAFPDSWTKFGINEKGDKVEISDSQRYKMMGNALTTNVVAEIIKTLF